MKLIQVITQSFFILGAIFKEGLAPYADSYLTYLTTSEKSTFFVLETQQGWYTLGDFFIKNHNLSFDYGGYKNRNDIFWVKWVFNEPIKKCIDLV